MSEREKYLGELEARVSEARAALDRAYEEAGETTPATEEALRVWVSLSDCLRYNREAWVHAVAGDAQRVILYRTHRRMAEYLKEYLEENPGLLDALVNATRPQPYPNGFAPRAEPHGPISRTEYAASAGNRRPIQRGFAKPKGRA